MLENKVLSPKRSNPFVQDEGSLEIKFGPRRMPLQTIDQNNGQKLALRNPRISENWSNKEEESLMVYFFQKIVDEPYLNFRWNIFKDQKNLMRASRKVKRSIGQCMRKIDLIESVQDQNYSELNVVDFLIVYWKRQQFTDKTGRDLIQKIRGLKKTKSEHMRMMEQKMEQMKFEQPALDKLYELIMRN